MKNEMEHLLIRSNLYCEIIHFEFFLLLCELSVCFSFSFLFLVKGLKAYIPTKDIICEEITCWLFFLKLKGSQTNQMPLNPVCCLLPSLLSRLCMKSPSENVSLHTCEILHIFSWTLSLTAGAESCGHVSVMNNLHIDQASGQQLPRHRWNEPN